MDLNINPEFELAERYVMETGVSLFLTGKAGTGKTTFLRHIVEHCTKRSVVVAPTGVAAVNAGGVTIHSFFQLPLCPYLPDVPELVTEYQMPEHKRQLRKSKQDIIRTLELLIIDEISMVRADLLDAIDNTLRHVRHSNRPFGGVQLLMIGDVQQLAPVVTDEEKPYMDRVYPSPFFFHSKSLQRLQYVTIQLTTVYRQQDPAFLSLLNNIRDNQFNAETLAALNAQVQLPGAKKEDANGCSDPILLTTHNYQADQVNQRRLAELEGREHKFKAVVTGNFPESSIPTDMVLTLKKKAQVMFVKNDSSGAHRYYNGKIGTVDDFSEEVDEEGNSHAVIIVVDEDGESIRVTPEKWENIKYEIDPADKQIKQYTDGTFSQYPLRTAWAITIHKAQGLTFDRVQVDAANAFAFGQVYVALSRCRSLQGLTLLSPLTSRCGFASRDIEQFNATFTPAEQAKSMVSTYQLQYFYDKLFELFDFSALQHEVEQLNRCCQDNLRTTYPKQCAQLTKMTGDVASFCNVSERFHGQLTAISQLSQDQSKPLLDERVAKAATYFLSQLQPIDDTLQLILSVSIDNKEVRRRVDEVGERLFAQIGLKIELLNMVQHEGFSIQRYQAVKVDKTLARNDKKKKKKEEADIYADVKHPRLVKILTRWRSSKAKEEGLPAYVVLQQKSLLAIADTLPQDGRALLKIVGLGAAKVARYGLELQQIVQDYCEEQASKKEPVWMRAAALFAEGKRVDVIASEMLRAESTVEGYLFTAVENGTLDADMILDEQGQEEIVEYLLAHPDVTTLKQVFEHFQERYTYLQLRVARSLAASLRR